jgi:hypothetical protein
MTFGPGHGNPTLAPVFMHSASRWAHDALLAVLHACCNVCASSVAALGDDDARVDMTAGALDDDPVVLPVVHVHTAAKRPWYEIADSLPQFPEFPPDEFRSEYE